MQTERRQLHNGRGLSASGNAGPDVPEAMYQEDYFGACAAALRKRFPEVPGGRFGENEIENQIENSIEN